MRRGISILILIASLTTAGCLLLLRSTNLEERIIAQEIYPTKKGRIERTVTYHPRIDLTENKTTEYKEEVKEESRIIQYQNGATEIIEILTQNTKVTTKYDPNGNQTEQYRQEYVPHENSSNYSYITTYFNSQGDPTEKRIEVFDSNNRFLRSITEYYDSNETREESIEIKDGKLIVNETKIKEE